MVILGLLLLAAAIAAGVEFGLSNMGETGFEVFGTSYTTTIAGLFGLGAATMAVAALGLWMIAHAIKRRRRSRYEAKHRVEREETQNRLGEYDRTTAELVEENDRLRGELADERRAAATMGGVAVPPGAGDVAYGDQVSDAVRSDAISDTGRFEPYPHDGTGTVSPVGETRPQTIDNTKFDDDHLRVGTNGSNTVTGEEKAGVLGRFRGDNR